MLNSIIKAARSHTRLLVMSLRFLGIYGSRSNYRQHLALDGYVNKKSTCNGKDVYKA